MTRHLFLGILAFLIQDSHAQTIEKFQELPFDSISKKVEFSRVIYLEGFNQNEILISLDLLLRQFIPGGEFSTQKSLRYYDGYVPAGFFPTGTTHTRQNDSTIVKTYNFMTYDRGLANYKNFEATVTALIKDNRIKLIFSDFKSSTYTNDSYWFASTSPNQIQKNKKGLKTVNAYLLFSFRIEELLLESIKKTSLDF